MAFFEERLDPCYSFGARGGPVFSTTVNKSTSGQRFANRNWTYPLHRYDISEGVKTKADFDRIRAFFYNVYGRADGFRFKDWADYEATAQPATLVTGSTYQLLKRYTTGARSFDRPIQKPVTVAAFRTRTGVTTSISPTVDLTTGQITVTGHTSGDTYSWTGEFDVPVTFVNDQLEAEIVNRGSAGLLIEWPSIQLEEFRL